MAGILFCVFGIEQEWGSAGGGQAGEHAGLPCRRAGRSPLRAEGSQGGAKRRRSIPLQDSGKENTDEQMEEIHRELYEFMDIVFCRE